MFIFSHLFPCINLNNQNQLRSQRVDVFGVPYVRKISGIKNLVAGGSNVLINCPYSGYPIQKISWHKDGKSRKITKTNMSNILSNIPQFNYYNSQQLPNNHVTLLQMKSSR